MQTVLSLQVWSTVTVNLCLQRPASANLCVGNAQNGSKIM